MEGKFQEANRQQAFIHRANKKKLQEKKVYLKYVNT